MSSFEEGQVTLREIGKFEEGFPVMLAFWRDWIGRHTDIPIVFDFSKEPMPEVCRCGHSRHVHCLGGDEPHCRVYPCLCIDFLPAVDRASMELAFKALQSTNKPITLEELRAEARVKELEVARQEGRKEAVEFVETFMPSIKQGINGEIWQIKKKEWEI